jgi:chromatin segregation and condensation protein Rec8/ScpA/Scc1 (kleisin family)
MSGYWKLFKKELHEKLWRSAFWALVEFLKGGDIEHERETNAVDDLEARHREKLDKFSKCNCKCQCKDSTRSEG